MNPISIHCSILCFYDSVYDISNIINILDTIQSFNITYKSEYHIYVTLRNNSNIHNDELSRLKKNYTDLKIEIITSENYGYGLGHNLNVLNTDAKYYLILNDDLIFKNLDWINTAISLIDNQDTYAAAGGSNNPSVLDENGFGYVSKLKSSILEKDYIDGSILLIKSNVFNKIKGFNNSIEYFYFEDADLSLRLKQSGFKLYHMEIPHDHNRSSSADKLPEITCRSIVESNRAKFITKWNGYLGSKKITNRILIQLTLDGIGDIVDCLYIAKQLIQNHIENYVDIELKNNKLLFLYDFLKTQHPNTVISTAHKTQNYDTIYKFDHINFSYPFHTIDLLSAAACLTDIDTEEFDIKQYLNQLVPDNSSISYLFNRKYITVHLDSQRTSFHSRGVNPTDILPIIQGLIDAGHHLCIIGQNTQHDEINAFLSNHKQISDYRDTSIKDTALLINKSYMFFGIDSGPSHIAQLLNIPSYILYGPVHPLTKIYRYHNSGCYYDNNNGGLYHRNIQPSYYYDLTRNHEFLKINIPILLYDVSKFIENQFVFNWYLYHESLRKKQLESAIIQLQNPIMNSFNLMKKENHSIKNFTDQFINTKYYKYLRQS